ncbi:MAG: hypothetical protein VX617_01365 [Pseudomonadota bacterium]|nr:hypothetical protein [Pseudomonadota bacterium]
METEEKVVIYNDDPKVIAAYLLEKHGCALAMEKTQKGITNAQNRSKYYDLSIWREVKAILEKKTNLQES